MHARLPEIHRPGGPRQQLQASQSLDQLPAAPQQQQPAPRLPSIKGAKKRSKRVSQDDLTVPLRSKQGPALSRQSSVPPEDCEEELAAGRRKPKNRVKINTKKFEHQFSSAVYPEPNDNPLRKVLTQHMLDPASPAAKSDIKTFWLYVVALMSRTAFMHCLNAPFCPFAGPEAAQLAQSRLAANVMLVRNIKRRCKWFTKVVKVKTDFVRNHGWKLVLFWRCIQRRKAVTLLRRMLVDYESFRLPYLMLRYRVNAVHLQRYVRSFLEVTESRKHALLIKWHKIAAHMTANLIPFLFEQQAKEEEARKRRDRDKWQGVQIDAALLPSIGARVNMITKKTAALQIQIHESEVTIQKHRMEMFVKRNKRKKSSRMKLAALRCGESTRRSALKHKHDEDRQGLRQQHNYLQSNASADESRLISAKVSKFIYECRRACKFVEQHKIIVREKKRKDGMTCEEAKRILTNPFAAKLFAEELSNTEVKLEKICLFIFSAQQDEAFRLLVENHLRAENDFELVEDCTEYDIFHSNT